LLAATIYVYGHFVRRRMRDPVSVIEAAYETEPDESDWLKGICERLGPALGLSPDRGEGVGAYFFDASDLRHPRVGIKVAVGLPSAWFDLAVRIAQRAGVAEKTVLAHTVGTLSDAFGPRFEGIAREFIHPLGYSDVIGFTVIDPHRTGFVLAAMVNEVTKLSARQVELWSRVAAHLAAGLRIRRQLADLAGADDAQSVEAVLHPDGRVEHAQPPASSLTARAALREAVVALDRARSGLRRRDPEEAVSIWKGLVAGRWSVADHFDRDGRRYVLARRNDPSAPGHAGLSARECQVVAYAALGHSNKLIAYTLGLSLSAVAMHLRAAASKLGVESRIALIRAVGLLGARSQPDGP
jgi:DNA-binding CsgD family transcriptional regulator